MKKVIVFMLSLLIVTIGLGWSYSEKKTTDKTFTITGSNWDKFEGDLVEIVVADTSVSGALIKATSTVKNGKFSCTGTIQYPQNAVFVVKKDDVYHLKDLIILEPGVINIQYKPDNPMISKIIISGGKYNQIVRNKVFNDPECLAKEKAYYEYLNTLSKEDSDDETKKLKDYKLSGAIYAARFAKFDNIRHNDPDPYARLLAMSYSRLRSNPETISELEELEKELGSIPEIVVLLYQLKGAESRTKAFQKIGVGTTIKDFLAKDFTGKEFHLADVLKENKYVLVEFWASWCSPCRAEIPYMKKAYEKYKDKEFEIISFTLDNDQKKWEKASQEEGIPWIDVGDLLAFKSPVVKMYGIGGVPMNYLVNKEGTIIAIHLRRKELDQKLEELLGE